MADQQTYKVFVGDLPADISEVELKAVFQTYGEVVSIFIMQPNAKGQCCAFIMYATLEAGEDAIKVLDNVYKIRENAQYPIKVSWARDKGDRGAPSASGPPPPDDSGFKLFVGGLPVDIREEELKMVFSTYGEVNKVHIMPPKDSGTRIAAFVYYSTREAGEDAMGVLHNQYKIRQDAEAPIQVRWANPKDKGAGKGWNAGGGQGGGWNNSGAPQQHYGGGGRGGPSYGEQKCVCPDGYKLFVAGLPSDCSEEELRMVFGTYGEVSKVHVMPPHQISGRVAAFVVYVHEKSADDAIQILSGVYKIRENADAPIQVKWANDKSGGNDQRWSGGGYGGQAGRHQQEQHQQQWGGKGGGGSKGGDWQQGGRDDAPTGKLFVGSLPPDVSEESLTYVFGTYGKVTSVHVMQGKSQTGNACAFVEYANPSEADVAILTLHDKYEIKPGFGCIVVKKAHAKQQRSRPY